MARQKPYNLHKRTIKKRTDRPTYVYNYSINPSSGVSAAICKQEQRKSTGCSTIAEATAFVIARIEKLKNNGVPSSTLTFGEYAEPFYDWDRCPHVTRLRSEGKSITRKHASNQRYLAKNHVFTDEILSEIPLAELRKADLVDFRNRLVKRIGRCRTSQNAFDLAKTICKEAYFREDIDRDITVGLGKIQYDSVEPGIFTEEELRDLFKKCPGHFVDIYDYSVFLLAASVGLRRGEIRALKWSDINFKTGHLTVDRAWKGKELGKPKWGKIRPTVIPKIALKSLSDLKSESKRNSGDDYIFCYADGSVFGETWWQKHFEKAMKSAGIDAKSRDLKPHSFRHTINSLLLAGGQSAEVTRASMGWSSKDVQEGYTHWKPEFFEDQANRVDEMFDGSAEADDGAMFGETI